MIRREYQRKCSSLVRSSRLVSNGYEIKSLSLSSIILCTFGSTERLWKDSCGYACHDDVCVAKEADGLSNETTNKLRRIVRFISTVRQMNAAERFQCVTYWLIATGRSNDQTEEERDDEEEKDTFTFFSFLTSSCFNVVMLLLLFVWRNACLTVA